MGNSLLDFVMALVRDSEVSARYAADPAGVLADAHLPGVTIDDVNNLIPVVTDSLAAATPGFGATVDPGNVWTTGAAVAALDAFEIHHPLGGDRPLVLQPAVTLPPDAAHPAQVGHDQPVSEAASPGASGGTPIDPPLDPVNPDTPDDAAWRHPHGDSASAHQHGDPPGFDLF